MRALHLLALAAVALILTLAGCGGGGSVVPPPTTTTSISGRVVDADGNGIDGATVSVEATRAPITTTTSGGGYYTLQGVPVLTDLTLTVTPQGGTAVTYRGIQVTANSGGATPLHVVYSTETPPPPPWGDPTISILPPDATVSIGTTPTYRAYLDHDGLVQRAVWTVTGAVGEVTNGGESFTILPGAAGTTIRLRAMVRLADGRVVTAERTLTVENPGGDGEEEPPPLPPG